MQAWMPYKFFEHQQFTKKDINIEDVICACTCQGSIVLGDQLATIMNVKSPEEEAQTYTLFCDRMLTMVAPTQSNTVLYVTERNNNIEFRLQTMETDELVGFLSVPKADDSDTVQYVAISPKGQYIAYENRAQVKIYSVPGASSRDKTMSLVKTLDFDAPVTSVNITRDIQLRNVVYITTLSGVYSFTVQTELFKSSKLICIDSIGASTPLTTLSDKGRLAVCRENKLSLYTAAGPDPVMPSIELDAKPIRIYWFRTYLVCIFDREAGESLKIYELDTHCIFGASKFGLSAKFVLFVWGSIVLLKGDGKITLLKEFDTKYKVHQLCTSSRQFEVALKLSKSHRMSGEEIAEIRRQLGDSYVQRRNYEAAVNEYIETIGFLEPSYVINIFLDPQHAEYLVRYLEELHNRGCEESLHTTLRFNCYTKLKRAEALSKIVSQCVQAALEGEKPNFDVDAAIGVLSKGGYVDEATALAKAYNLYASYCQIMAGVGKYDKVAEYIPTMPARFAAFAVVQYGPRILEELSEDARREFCLSVVKMCTEGCLVRPDRSEERKRLQPENLVQIFTEYHDLEHLFLTRLVAADAEVLNTDLWNRLIASTLELDKDSIVDVVNHPQAKYSDEFALFALKNAVAPMEQQLKAYDDAMRKINMAKASGREPDMSKLPDIDREKVCGDALVYRKALVTIYEHRKCFKEILYQAAPEEIPDICVRYSKEDPGIWTEGLKTANAADCEPALRRMVALILDGGVMRLNEIIGYLERSKTASWDMFADFTLKEFQRLQTEVDEKYEKLEKLDAAVNKKYDRAEEINTRYYSFRPTRCATCNQEVQFPARYFKCNHVYHLSCLGDEADFCVLCKHKHEEAARRKCEQLDEAHAKAEVLERMRDAEDGIQVIEDVLATGLFMPDADEDEEKRIREYYRKIIGEEDD